MNKTTYLAMLVICEAIIIGLYQFAPCYSPLTGRPNFFHVWMQEVNLLWFSMMGFINVLVLIFERSKS